MSNLFMDMHRRCQNRVAEDKDTVAYSNNSFMSPMYTDNFASSVASDDANEAEDEIANILSLKLKKPKHWRWELSTSRSCSNIALPRILLYDHKGELFVDANSPDEQIYAQSVKTPQRKAERRKRTSRASTTNLAHSIHQTLNQEFDGLHIQEATPSLLSPANSSQHTRNSSPAGTSSSCIDFFTNDLPDYKFERRSSSLKSVRFKEDIPKSPANSFQLGDLPTPPPSSGTTPTTSSSGPREKRRYRRSQSNGRSPVNSPSILERFSFTKGRFSSPEYAQEQEVYHSPRYFLRTSKAGTLVVQEESFSRCRRRQLRPKNSSCENVYNHMLPRSQSTSSFKIARPINSEQLQCENNFNTAASLEDFSEKRKHRRKKNFASRRHRSDCNVLLQSTLSTSEEDVNPKHSRANHLDILDDIRRPQRKHESLKRHLKGDLVTIHPENGVLHPYGSPPER